MAQHVMNMTNIHEDVRMIPGLPQRVKDLVCGVGRRSGSDTVLQSSWGRPAVTAPIQPLAWELPYASGGGTKRQKTNKRTNKKT